MGPTTGQWRERASGRTRATGNTFIPHEHTANVLSPLPLKDRICQQLFYIAPFLFHSLFGLCPFSWCCMWRPRSNPKLFHDGSTTTLEMLEIIQFFFFEEPQNHSSLDGHENCNIVVVARSSLNILFPLPHSHPPTKP